MREIKDNGIIQGSLDWYRQRLGHYTGSEIYKLLANGRLLKNEIFTVTAKSYITHVWMERALSNKIVNDDEQFQLYVDMVNTYNKFIAWGHEQEINAIALYEQLRGVQVSFCSSVEHPEIPHYAASPDGYIEAEDKVIEVKSPSSEKAFKYMQLIHNGDDLLKVIPDYYWQVQAEMDCTGATSCDFIVYCPFLAKPIHIVGIPREEEAIERIHERIFLAEEYGKKYYSQVN